MSELYFTATHEWVCFCAGRALVGITGKEITGDVVYAELPEIGQSIEAGQQCASIESAKSVFEVYAPLSGKVAAINDTIYDAPEIISDKPLKTWLFILEEFQSKEGLLTKSEYETI